MFGCIVNQFENSVFSNLDPNKFTREERIIQLVQYLAKRSGLTAEFKVLIDPNFFDVIPNCNLDTIFYPRLTLLTFLDLKENYRIRTLSEFDEKSKDQDWFHGFMVHVARILKPEYQELREETILRIISNQNLLNNIRLYIKYLEGDEKLIAAGFCFTMLHELGHLHYKHHSDKTISQKYPLLGGVGSGIAVLGIYFLIHSVMGIVIAASVAIAVGLIARKLIFCGMMVAKSHRHENQADEYAISALKGEDGEIIRQGACYLFNTVKQFQREFRNRNGQSWKQKLLSKIAISSEGDSRGLYLTHPSETARIKNIQRFKSSPVQQLVESRLFVA